MITAILKGTPWWVYALFSYAILTGIKAMKPRVIPFKKIFILPSLFLAWGLYSFSTKITATLDIAIWLPFLVLGVLTGWKLTSFSKIQSDKENALIKLPGSAQTLVLILLVFSTKYFYGYSYATDPGLKGNFIFVASDLISSGSITGIFLGRVLNIWQKWKNSAHIELQER